MDLLEWAAWEYICSQPSPQPTPGAFSGEDSLNHQADSLENWTHCVTVRCFFLQSQLCLDNETRYGGVMVAEMRAMQGWNNINISYIS